jgi:hypothetical protein
MKHYENQNVDKTRRAVVTGKRVCFYRRSARKGTYCSPYPVWNEFYEDFEVACQAADAWVNRGILLAGRRKLTRSRMSALSEATQTA